MPTRKTSPSSSQVIFYLFSFLCVCVCLCESVPSSHIVLVLVVSCSSSGIVLCSPPRSPSVGYFWSDFSNFIRFVQLPRVKSPRPTFNQWRTVAIELPGVLQSLVSFRDTNTRVLPYSPSVVTSVFYPLSKCAKERGAPGWFLSLSLPVPLWLFAKLNRIKALN